MKKIIISILTVMLLMSFTVVLADDFSIHNGVIFGMTKNNVKEAEMSAGFTYGSDSDDLFGRCKQHKSFLTFSGTVAGIDGANITYHFNSQDALESAIYTLGFSTAKYGTNELFSSLSDSLASKYGNEDAIAKIMIEDSYLDCCVNAYYERWETAVSKVEVTASKAFTYNTDDGNTIVIYISSLNISLSTGKSAGEGLYIIYQLYDADTYSNAYEKVGSDATNAYDDL